MRVFIAPKEDTCYKKYSVIFINTTEDEQALVDKWMLENIKDLEIQTPGKWYTFEYEEDFIACKLRWL